MIFFRVNKENKREEGFFFTRKVCKISYVEQIQKIKKNVIFWTGVLR